MTLERILDYLKTTRFVRTNLRFLSLQRLSNQHRKLGFEWTFLSKDKLDQWIPEKADLLDLSSDLMELLYYVLEYDTYMLVFLILQISDIIPMIPASFVLIFT
jgi:hypothetical protein